MFYEEGCRVEIYSCSFDFNQGIGKEYLKCKTMIYTSNHNSEIYTSKISRTAQTVKFYGEREELEKIQQALTKALEEDKKKISVYTDIRIVPTVWKKGTAYTVYYNYFVEKFVYCKTRLAYMKDHRTDQENKVLKIARLESEIKKALRFKNNVSKKADINKPTQSRKRKSVVLEEEEQQFIEEISDSISYEEEYDKFVEEEVEPTQEKVEEKPKIKDFFEDMFGSSENQW